MTASPARIASWTAFAAGLLLAGGSRLALGQPWWLGAGLGLIGLSMLLDVLLPGGSRLSDVQIVTFRRIGIGDPQQWHRRASLFLGTVLLPIGAYVALRFG